MDEALVGILAVILLLIGIAGTILPVIPGLLLSFCGLLIYKFGTSTELSMIWIWIFGILTVISVFLDYIIPAKTNKKYGGTHYGSIGSVVGTIAGMLFIPVPFGFLIGMFAGVFIGELVHDSKDKKKAFSSMKGAFIGFLYGTGFNLVLGLAMFLVVVIDLI